MRGYLCNQRNHSRASRSQSSTMKSRLSESNSDGGDTDVSEDQAPGARRDRTGEHSNEQHPSEINDMIYPDWR